MPRRIEREGLTWCRPWLDARREAIDAYVRRHRLTFVNDESNTDPRLARSRLRTAVWPALTAAFPDAEAALATSAEIAAEARAALDELGAIDLRALVDDDAALRLAAWRALSEPRRSNALRAWLATRGAGMPQAAQTRSLAREIDAPGAARWLVGSIELRRHRGRLLVARPVPRVDRSDRAGLDLARPGLHTIADWPGALEVTPVDANGVAAACLAEVRAVARRGGERFQLGMARPARSLKKQYQSLGIPSWERDAPLLYCGDRLLFAAGLGIDARAVAPRGEPQFALRWLPDAGR
jgi:tRNA(Ile)-lysidine synthase